MSSCGFAGWCIHAKWPPFGSGIDLLIQVVVRIHFTMKTSLNGNIFGVIGHSLPLTVEFPSQKPVTRGFDVFFELHLYNRLSKQSKHRRIETPSHSLWRHCNDNGITELIIGHREQELLFDQALRLMGRRHQEYPFKVHLNALRSIQNGRRFPDDIFKQIQTPHAFLWSLFHNLYVWFVSFCAQIVQKQPKLWDIGLIFSIQNTDLIIFCLALRVPHFVHPCPNQGPFCTYLYMSHEGLSQWEKTLHWAPFCIYALAR